MLPWRVKITQPLLSLGKPLFEMRSVYVGIAQIAFEQTNEEFAHELSQVQH